MGALISRFTGSRVGSSSFYEQYERNFEGLKEYIIKLKVQRITLKSHEKLIGHVADGMSVIAEV